MSEYEDIKLERTPGDPLSDTIETHPSFGQIVATRTSGQRLLYGTEFEHQHYVSIEIRGSRRYRGLSHDSYYGGDSLIRVALSEAQWATFVSSMNVGFGPPCTIDRIGNKNIPQFPNRRDTKKVFENEVRERLASLRSDIKALIAEIGELKLSQKAKDALAQKLDSISYRVTQQEAFTQQQFTEHMEHTIASAKAEVNAYHLMMNGGLIGPGETHEPVVLIEVDGEEEG